MTEYTEYTRTASAAVAEGLQQAKDIKLATIEVLKSLTSVLVPMSVALLPDSEKLVSTIDTAVERSFDTALKVVESQHQLGVTALDQWSTTVAS
jgi:hypothetical protein